MYKNTQSPIEALNISYYQQTLKESFVCMGRGLHTGLRVIMTVLPAEANTGYRFIRSDLPINRNEILAAWHTVSDTHLSTTVSNNMGSRVSTIEHLMAALHASGVDNARIILDGPEVPIMDGSAKPFVQMIESVGLKTLNEERKAIVVKKSLSIREGNKEVSLSPSPIPLLELEINFKSPVIGKQCLSMPLSAGNFHHHIAPARTFGFIEQLNTLKQLGFARGGSLQNAILVDEDGVVNESGLRFKDEFVRHKMLDCIGDLALVGGPILGCLKAKCSGHKLNNDLLHELMLNEDCYDYISLKKADERWQKHLAAEMNGTVHLMH